MGRQFIAILAGIATGLLLIALVPVFVKTMFPFPENLDWKNPEDMKIYYSNLPDKAFVILASAHALGTLLTGLIASLVSRKGRFTNGIIAASVIFAIIIVINFTYDYPKFYLMIDTFVTAIAGFLGSAIGHRRQV